MELQILLDSGAGLSVGKATVIPIAIGADQGNHPGRKGKERAEFSRFLE